MTLDEFYSEPAREIKRAPELKKPAPIIVDPYGDLEEIEKEEVLPPNVFKAYVQGEVCYMTITEDGRQVRLDEFDVRGAD